MHRNLQREFAEHGLDDLTAALASLYAHVYGVPADRVRAAAAHRAEAMKISDAWVEAGVRRHQSRRSRPSATSWSRGTPSSARPCAERSVTL